MALAEVVMLSPSLENLALSASVVTSVAFAHEAQSGPANLTDGELTGLGDDVGPYQPILQSWVGAPSVSFMFPSPVDVARVLVYGRLSDSASRAAASDLALNSIVELLDADGVVLFARTLDAFSPGELLPGTNSSTTLWNCSVQPLPAAARLRLRQPAPQYLHMTEVTALSAAGRNIAWSGTGANVSFSSQGSDDVWDVNGVSVANDLSPGAPWDAARGRWFCSATADGSEWWAVTFAAPSVLSSVVIVNRRDLSCPASPSGDCGARLIGAVAEVFDAQDVLLAQMRIRTLESVYSWVLGPARPPLLPSSSAMPSRTRTRSATASSTADSSATATETPSNTVSSSVTASLTASGVAANETSPSLTASSTASLSPTRSGATSYTSTANSTRTRSPTRSPLRAAATITCYVRMESAAGRCLSFRELQLWDISGVNVALGGVILSSPSASNSTPARFGCDGVITFDSGFVQS